jgi:hypothetical protein
LLPDERKRRFLSGKGINAGGRTSNKHCFNMGCATEHHFFSGSTSSTKMPEELFGLINATLELWAPFRASLSINWIPLDWR